MVSLKVLIIIGFCGLLVWSIAIFVPFGIFCRVWTVCSVCGVFGMVIVRSLEIFRITFMFSLVIFNSLKVPTASCHGFNCIDL